MKLVHADMRLDFYSGGGGGGVGTLRLTARAMDDSHAAFDLTSPSSSFDLTSSSSRRRRPQDISQKSSNRLSFGTHFHGRSVVNDARADDVYNV